MNLRKTLAFASVFTYVRSENYFFSGVDRVHPKLLIINYSLLIKKSTRICECLLFYLFALRIAKFFLFCLYKDLNTSKPLS